MSGELALVANAGDQTITTFTITPDDLVLLATSRPGGKCSTFAIDHERDLVYAGIGGSEPAIVTLSLDRDSGSLTEQSRIEVTGSPTYLALTPDGSRLLGAFYHEGRGQAWTISDGVLSAGPNAISYPNLHCVVSATSDQAYFVSLGADLVVGVTLGEDASLAALGEYPAPPGSGPRHCVLNADLTAAYVLTEFTGEALHYRRDGDGHLTLVAATPAFHPARGLATSRFGADPRAGHLIWGADLHLSADQSFLWCSERTESTISTLPVAHDGTLGQPTSYTNVEPQPRGFGVLDDGRLVVAGERSTTVSLYRTTRGGGLERVVSVETGAGANWVRSAGASGA